MNFKEDIERILIDEGISGIERHASVSTQNQHKCSECFCCACVDWLKENRAAFLSGEYKPECIDKNRLYINGKWRCEVPPVCTEKWGAAEWINWIDHAGQWLF